MVQEVIKGQHINDKSIFYQSFNKINIKTKKKSFFMADGELLDYSNEFKIQNIPKELTVRYYGFSSTKKSE